MSGYRFSVGIRGYIHCQGEGLKVGIVVGVRIRVCVASRGQVGFRES